MLSQINFSDNVIKQIASVSTYKYAENDNIAVVPRDMLSKMVRCDYVYVIGHPENFLTKTALLLKYLDLMYGSPV